MDFRLMDKYQLTKKKRDHPKKTILFLIMRFGTASLQHKEKKLPYSFIIL